MSLAELDPEFLAKQDDEELIAVKCSCFSFLKTKTMYDVFLVMK